jgi:hypothetical protein
MILRRTPVLAVAALAALVALAAPAGAGESKSDRALLKAGVVTKADVPSDWTSKKGSSSDPDRSIRECRRIRAAIDKAKKTVPRADSRDFSDPATQGATSAQSTVYAFKDASAAGRLLANFEEAATGPCLEQNVARSPIGRRAGTPPTITPITDLAGVGDEAIGYEIVLDLTVRDETASIYVDFVAVRVGRAFVGFGFTNIGERIPEGPSIVQAVVGRVADAQAPA